jgi:hypothetical protein
MIDACHLDRSFPEFITALDQFTKTFQYFNRFAVAILNSAHCEQDPRSRLEQSGVWQAGRTLLRQWVNFVNRLNELTLGQTAPMFALIVAAIVRIVPALDEMADLFLVGTLQTAVSPTLMFSINAELVNLHEIAVHPPTEISAFAEKVHRWTAAVGGLFFGALPRHTTATGENMLTRINLKIGVQELENLTDALTTLDELSARTKVCSVELNAQIADLLRQLGLPWKLLITNKGTAGIEIDESALDLKPVEPQAPTSSPRRRQTH